MGVGLVVWGGQSWWLLFGGIVGLAVGLGWSILVVACGGIVGLAGWRCAFVWEQGAWVFGVVHGGFAVSGRGGSCVSGWCWMMVDGLVMGKWVGEILKVCVRLGGE